MDENRSDFMRFWGGSAKTLGNGNPLVTALDPRDGGEWDVRIDVKRIAFCKGQPWATQELRTTVLETLAKPAEIHMGLKCDLGLESDGWLCYVAYPTRRFREAPPVRDGKPNTAVREVDGGGRPVLPHKSMTPGRGSWRRYG